MNNKWVEGKYGTHYLSIGKDLIKASISWSTHREDNGYKVTINGKNFKKIFADIPTAKAEVERAIKHFINLALEDLEK